MGAKIGVLLNCGQQSQFSKVRREFDAGRVYLDPPMTCADWPVPGNLTLLHTQTAYTLKPWHQGSFDCESGIPWSGMEWFSSILMAFFIQVRNWAYIPCSDAKSLQATYYYMCQLVYCSRVIPEAVWTITHDHLGIGTVPGELTVYSESNNMLNTNCFVKFHRKRLEMKTETERYQTF